MRAIHLPKYDNPYQDLLAGALVRQGVEIDFRKTLPTSDEIRAMAAESEPPILHLHWLHPLFRQTNWFAPIHYMRFRRRICLIARAGIPIVWTLHNLLPHERMYRALGRTSRHLMRRHASAILTHCDDGRRQFEQTFGPCPRIHVIPPQGHYRDVYPAAPPQSEARARLGLPDDAFVYLAFGMMRGYKGLDDLMKAFRASAGEKDYLLIAGHIYHRRLKDELEKEARSSTRIILHARFVADEEIPLYYSAANAAVCSFRQVLNSGSIILAMTYGLPVVAPRMGCVPSVVPEGAAVFYEAEKAGALGEALRAMRHADLAAMNNEAKRGADKLSWDECARQTADVYRKVLAKRRDIGS